MKFVHAKYDNRERREICEKQKPTKLVFKLHFLSRVLRISRLFKIASAKVSEQLSSLDS